MLKRLSLVLYLFAVAASARADCIAQVTANWNGSNNYFLDYSYFGSCNTNPHCAGVEMFSRWDHGDWTYVGSSQNFCAIGGNTSTQGFACFPAGTHTIELAVNCNKRVPDGSFCIPDTQGYASTSFTVDHGISIGQIRPGWVQNGAFNVFTQVSWEDDAPTLISIKAWHEMNRTQPSTWVSGSNGVNGDGTASWGMGYDANRPIIKLVAQACDKYAIRFFSVSDNQCCCGKEGSADCTGGPIRMSNGNMRFTDSDPLPGLTLSRTYDSRNNDTGWFGPGWASVLDEWLRTETEENGSKTIGIGTGGDDRYFFNGSNGVFGQLWPEGPSSASLHSDGAGGYVLREFGSSTERYFDGNGRIYKTRDVRDGREANFFYDSNGLITGVADSWSNWSWSITTDAVTHRITTIAVPGTSIAWTYIYSGGILTSVQESGNAWRTYTYGNGVLTAINDAAGNLIESHAYGADGATSSIGQTDDITSITYNNTTSDPNLRYTHVTMATGATTDYYERFAGGRYRTERVEGGCTSCPSRNAIHAYDSFGRLLREQNARGYITTRTYDTLNRILSETTALKPDGCDPETASDHCRLIGTLAAATLAATSATVTRTFTYDLTWYDHPATITTVSVLNPSGSRVESMTYDPPTGTMLTDSISGWTGSTSSPVQEQHTTWTTLYDGTEGAAFAPGGTFDSSWLPLPQPQGTRKWVDGPRTDVSDLTTFVYYPIHSTVPAVLRGRLAAIRNAAGHITRYENYDVFGNMQRIVDANEVATEFTFDHLGRSLTSTIKAVPGCSTTDDPLCATDLTSSRTYTPASGPLASQSDPNGNATAYEYDSRGRLATLSRGPSLSDLRERIAYTYDPATGHKSLEQYLGKESNSWIEKRHESFAYDALSQLVTQTHADASSIGYMYDPVGSVATVRDEIHATPNTTYVYDSAQRLTVIKQTLSTAPQGYITTSYGYDLAGNLISVTDPNGNVTAYAYDDFGRMLSQTSPVTGVTSYEYDPAGNLNLTVLANGAIFTREYDALNRPVNERATAHKVEDDLVWTYDDGTPGLFGFGRLASSSSPDSLETYAYDRRGLLRQENVTIWDDPFVQSYTYDAAGNRTSIGYPSGRVVTYEYDYADRQLTAAGLFNAESTTYVTSASYLPFGPLVSLAFGNGTLETRTYDTRYRPSSLALSASETTLAQYAYASDSAGNLTQITDLAGPAYNRTFGYDDLNRLITANSGTALWGNGSYIYDSMGNMLGSTLGSRTRTFTYAGATPRIATATDNEIVTSMTYDEAGNERSGPAGPDSYYTDTRTYSPRNLLSQIVLTSKVCMGPQHGEICHAYGQNYTTITNGFDARGVRVATTWSSSSHPVVFLGFPYLFYTPELTPLNTFSADGGGIPDIIWFAGRPVADDEPYFLRLRYTSTDHLGTPILQTDASGATVWRAEYEPFGNVYAMRVGSRNEQALRFPGQYVAFKNNSGDDESYNIFRWYRAGWGRYTQPDPMSRRQERYERFFPNVVPSAHAYNYADDRPIEQVDRSGLGAESILVAPGVGPAVVTGALAVVACMLTPECRRQVRCAAELAKDIARCTRMGLCSANEDPRKHNARVESCLIRSWLNWRACTSGWPRPYDDPWPGPGFRGPQSPTEPSDPPIPTHLEPPAMADPPVAAFGSR